MQEVVKTILEHAAFKEQEIIITQVREENQRLLNKIEIEFNQEKKQKLGELELELKGERAKRIGGALKKNQEEILHLQHQIVDKVKMVSWQELKKVRQNKDVYPKLLKQLLIESLAQVGKEEKVDVVVTKEDETIVKEIIKNLDPNLRVYSNDLDDPGVIVEVPARGYRVYNTLKLNLEKAKTSLLEQFQEIFK